MLLESEEVLFAVGDETDNDNSDEKKKTKKNKVKVNQENVRTWKNSYSRNKL